MAGLVVLVIVLIYAVSGVVLLKRSDRRARTDARREALRDAAERAAVAERRRDEPEWGWPR